MSNEVLEVIAITQQPSAVLSTQLVPMAGFVCPPGTVVLNGCSMLFVRQIVEMLEVFTGFDTNNRYEVLDPAGRRLFLAAEVTECCTRCCFGTKRPFRILLLNNSGGVVLTVKRPCTCCYCLCACCDGCNEVQMHTGGDVYMGKVLQKKTDCCCAKFSIYNANNDKVLQIDGPCRLCMCCSVHFKVSDTEGNVIGEIHKKWGGIMKEMMTTADTFGVSFPLNLDLGLKALLVGAVFLIDFMFFEGEQKQPHQQSY